MRCYTFWAGLAVIALAFQTMAAQAEPKISVLSATYGESCGAPSGNVTHRLARRCDGKQACRVKVDVDRMGDPAHGCRKDFALRYQCVAAMPTATVRREANGKTVALRCPSGEINVMSATYGRSCGVPEGNATRHVSYYCDGQASCDFTVDVKVLGDPAYGCAKNFALQYRCAYDDADVIEEYIRGEANQSSLVLRCF